ncbi:hypothetical protein ACJ72_05764 [Emergomyces africanus]|uniref:Transcription factor hoxa13 n=1 Tax=Emergomyces africanus TaxID=1955775 RepID=A0A1B7NSZ5_9EURO|nr:hypothetical protein ACJ72_05764 [Emergomyces africanus]
MAMAGAGVGAGDMKNSHLNGSSIRKQEDEQEKDQDRKRPTRFARWSLAVILRLVIWYALLTPFFYCPSALQDLDSNSPRVCKPYLIARSHIEPHVTPYYDAYGAPYVDTVRPYARAFNEKIYSPAASFANRNYRAYGAAYIEKGVSYIQNQCDEIVTPHIHSLQISLNRVYESSIQPHYIRVATVVTPYYRTTVAHVDKVRQSYIIPFYSQSKPVIVQAYSSTYDIVVNTIYPYSKKTWSYLMTFISETLLPGVARLYCENVEPQLLRIGEKLASYREGQKLGAVGEECETLTEQYISTPTTSSSATTVSPKTSDYSASTIPASPSISAPSPEPSVDKVNLARETIAMDLRTWQEKFAIAADKAAEDLDERVAKIVESHVHGAQESGEELVSELETVGNQELEALKTKINDIVRNLPDKSTPEDRKGAEDQLVQAIRTSGFAIRAAAQKLRQWLADFNSNLNVEVTAASDDTVEVLDQIRELSLQNIGMKWAWMDGVTYKDWAKYNTLKKQLHSWREEVREVGMQHGAYDEAKALGNDIVNRGMAIAEATAKELTRLREVGKWKIEAEDISDDFEMRTGNPTEARARKRAAMDLEEAEPEPDAEYQPSPSPEDETSEAVPLDEDFAMDADPAISDSEGMLESSDEGDSENSPSFADDHDATSSAIFINTMPTPERERETEPEPEPKPIVGDEDASPGAKVWGGAAAEFMEHENQVPANTPEHARDDTSRSSLQLSVSSNVAPSETALAEQSSIPMPPPEASSHYSDSISQAKKLYEIAHSAARAQDSGAADEGMVASIESAYSGSAQLASENLESRLKAASEYVGIPSSTAPTQTVNDDILSSASSKLQENLQRASLSLASKLASSTGESALPGQQIILDARRRYYEAVGLAHDEYSIFVHSASSSGHPLKETSITTPTSKPILEQANSEFSIASSLVSASLDAVLYSISSAGANIDPVSASSVIEDASSRFHDALSAATSSLSSVYSAAVETASSPTSDARETGRDEL